MSSTYLITGGTGFIGGHLAEACIKRGHKVRTIARTGSDTALLDRLGAEIIRGDILDSQTVQKAVDGVDVIVHCAGKVGDLGSAEEYRPINVEALRGLLEACKGKRISRFIH